MMEKVVRTKGYPSLLKCCTMSQARAVARYPPSAVKFICRPVWDICKRWHFSALSPIELYLAGLIPPEEVPDLEGCERRKMANGRRRVDRGPIKGTRSSPLRTLRLGPLNASCGNMASGCQNPTAGMLAGKSPQSVPLSCLKSAVPSLAQAGLRPYNRAHGTH